jgi:hypothetical protein
MRKITVQIEEYVNGSKRSSLRRTSSLKLHKRHVKTCAFSITAWLQAIQIKCSSPEPPDASFSKPNEGFLKLNMDSSFHVEERAGAIRQ